jgi:hypothetical protein
MTVQAATGRRGPKAVRSIRSNQAWPISSRRVGGAQWAE